MREPFTTKNGIRCGFFWAMMITVAAIMSLAYELQQEFRIQSRWIQVCKVT